ncbi:hypothetical protein IID19_03525 [Patescibacteria group bacterium]|nr:hypothetical protein [Patescibacteria group bacterium]
MKILQRTYIALLLAVFAFAMLIPPQVVRAATLETVEDHMNRQVQNQTSGVSHEIVFTVPAGNSGTEAEVHLIFPSADNGLWCETAGAITVAGSTTYAANELPGTLAATCTGTPDTLTITGVTNLSASTEYGVLLTDSGAGSLGTPTTGTDGVITVQTRDSGQTLIDEEQLAVDIIADDQVVVSADVDPTITVVLSANSINLGTLSTTQVNQDGITSTVTTNSSNGYSSQVLYDVTLTNAASDTISDTAGGTIVAGTEEFGASSSDTGNDIGIWSPTACADTGSTSNADALTTSLQTFASNTVAVSSEATTLCFLASIAGTTESGTYSNTVTVVTTGLF